MAKISRELRNFVTERAQGQCEYCQTAQINVIEMVVDHITPESKAGLTEAWNLCLSCISCNQFKNDRVEAVDPSSNVLVPLFNPRLQVWSDHFAWSEDGSEVIGLTATGRATVEALRMNRDLVVKVRLRWISVGWHPPK